MNKQHGSVSLVLSPLVLAGSLTACVTLENIVPESSGLAKKQFPLSAQVEVVSFKTIGISGLTWENSSIKQSITTYLRTRGTFREIVDGPADVVIRVNANWARTASRKSLLEFIVHDIFIVEVLLFTGDTNSPLGFYIGKGQYDMGLFNPVTRYSPKLWTAGKKVAYLSG